MQMLTIEDLLHGAEVEMPPQYSTFKEARRARMGGKHIPSSTSRLAIAAASRLP